LPDRADVVKNPDSGHSANDQVSQENHPKKRRESLPPFLSEELVWFFSLVPRKKSWVDSGSGSLPSE
jgi:hypothetical protein